MKAIYWVSGLSLGVAVIAWLARVKRQEREGKNPMSRRWLVENAYERDGDRRWK